jgi:hypothetical protein
MTTEWIDQGEVAAESQADPAMAVGEPRNPFLVALASGCAPCVRARA